MQRISLLGATGSIGAGTLDVVSYHPNELSIVALSAGSNAARLAALARKYHPEVVCIGRPELAAELRTALPGITVLAGAEGLLECACWPSATTVVNAVVGAAGLAPTYAAALSGKRICLANKEALVAGGALVMAAVREHNCELLPIDSEHSAIFQCLGQNTAAAERIYLTCSGGPFRISTAAQLEQVTPQAALRHPNWHMGGKITIDSATLVNKGLEVIEAHWLFSLDWEQIQVVVHPQSIIHSMVEFTDGSILAQLGAPDMRLPIQVALLHPKRLPGPSQRLNFLAIKELTFEAPDLNRFPGLKLAWEAGRIGGTMPAVLNAANEVAVGLFLQNRLGFTAIPRLIEACMEKHAVTNATNIHEILEADQQARVTAAELAAAWA